MGERDLRLEDSRRQASAQGIFISAQAVFAANHRWAMAKGEESLRFELERLHNQASCPRR
jgi:hypothetical protein